MRCAGKSLRDCIVPTLLLVGGWDGPVIDMNKDALDKLAAPGLVPTFTTTITRPGSQSLLTRQVWCGGAVVRAVKELRIIPGATHLFEEPGKLEEVARQARDWFKKYLDTPQAPSASEER
jgi:hypothetical protein